MSAIAAATFQFLENSSSAIVDSILIEGLDCPDRTIQEESIRAIFVRRSRAGSHEVLRRFEEYPTSLSELIISYGSRITPALRDLLLETQPERYQLACRLICRLERYDFIPTLLRVLERTDKDCIQTASETLLWLTENLYARYRETAQSDDTEQCERVSAWRRQAVADLYEGVIRHENHRRNEVVDAYIILAEHEDESLPKLLDERLSAAHRIFMKRLAVLKHEGVYRLLLDLLEQPEIDPRLRQLIFNRSDREFILAMLDKLSDDVSANMKRALRRTKYIPWLTPEPEILDSYSGDQQVAIVRVTMESKTSRDTALEIIAHILLRGKLEGRRAAAEAIESFTGVKSNSIVVDALDDDDPKVLAALLRQLRGRSIPGIMPAILKHVNHPDPCVKESLRESLDEFSIKRFLSAFDNLEEPIRVSTGQLVLKLDPETIPTLHRELLSEVKTRKYRAIEIVRTLDLVRKLESALIHLANYDNDPLLRAEAITMLSTCRTEASRIAIENTTRDEDSMVRSTACRALQQLQAARNM